MMEQLTRRVDNAARISGTREGGREIHRSRVLNFRIVSLQNGLLRIVDGETLRHVHQLGGGGLLMLQYSAQARVQARVQISFGATRMQCFYAAALALCIYISVQHVDAAFFFSRFL